MEKQAIKLSDKFTYKKLIKFVIPSVVMMIFTSIYGIVDGLFISNYDGITAFAAVNLIMPVFFILGAIGFMLGAGGTAIVAKTLGQKEQQKANEYFALIVYVTAGLGALVVLIFLPLLPWICSLLGATGQMHTCCVRYGQITLLAQPFFMLQNLVQTFFVAAEKPKLGLFITVLAGVTNMVLDAVLVLLEILTRKSKLLLARHLVLVHQTAVVPFLRALASAHYKKRFSLQVLSQLR